MKIKFFFNKQPYFVVKTLKKFIKISEMYEEKYYIVGGVIRDAILCKTNYDIDIVLTQFNPSFIKELEKELDTCFSFSKKFNTAKAYLKNGISIDLNVQRKETYPFNGSLPIVSFGDEKSDILRRDFTINSIYIKILNGTVDIFDPVNGIKDLKNRKICFLKENSFLEDPTRILRGLKFAFRYSFSFEKNTKLALLDALKQDCFSTISSERLKKEFLLLLKEPTFHIYLNKNKYNKIFEYIFSFFTKENNLSLNNIKFIFKFLVLNTSLLKKLNIDKYYFFVFFISLSTEEIEKITFHSKNIINLNKNSEIYFYLNNFSNQELLLIMLYSNFKIENTKLLLKNSQFMKKSLNKIITKFLYLKKITPLLSGNDLLKIGIPQGKEFTNILNFAYTFQLNNKNITKKVLIREVKKIYGLSS